MDSSPQDATGDMTVRGGGGDKTALRNTQEKVGLHSSLTLLSARCSHLGRTITGLAEVLSVYGERPNLPLNIHKEIKRRGGASVRKDAAGKRREREVCVCH